MSTQTQITRISTAKTAIATAITGKGVTVPSGTKIDGMAALIDTITTGGELESITITTPPTKTSYIAGEDFDPTGMEVTAVVSGVSIPVTGYTVTPSTLTAGVTSVTIGLTVNGVTKSATQAVTVIAYKSFSECTWAEIAQYAADGVAKEAFAVGDTRTETIQGDEYELVIYDFDHYDLCVNDAKYSDISYNGGKGKAAILIGLTNLFDLAPFDDSNYKMWPSCSLRGLIRGSLFYNELPESLQDIIRSVNVYSIIDSNANTQLSYESVFLPAAYEVFGKVTTNSTTSPEVEGSQYAYYAAGNTKTKRFIGQSFFRPYLTRTTEFPADPYVLLVNANGSDTTDEMKTEDSAFSPVFCI